jgi:hypothetical protein
MSHAVIRTAAALAMMVALAAALAADPPDKDKAAQKQRLAEVQQLVGQWRGVGLPQRGSTQGSWVEEANWAWKFQAAGPALVAELPKTKYFQRLQLRTGDEAGQFVLVALPAAWGEAIEYSGRLEATSSGEEQQLVVIAKEPREGLPERLSFRFAAEGSRLVLLMEKRGAASGQFARLAEVGYTRQGSGFGKGAAGRECVVTGGLGTIAVMHNGQTHYVCCTGCRDYFNEQPEKVLAEHAARKAEK